MTTPAGSGMARAAWVRSYRENAIIGLIAISYFLAASALLSIWGLPPPKLRSVLSNGLLFVAGALVIFGPALLLGLALARPGNPLRWAADKSVELRLAERAALALPALLALTLFMATFSTMKSAIPVFHPYSWDPLLADMDQRLHGADPWRLLQPLIGWPFVSFLINVAYHLWLLLLYVGVLAVSGWIERPALRQQFLLTYALSWIIVGNIGAIWLSSVGPCFYQHFFSSDRFEPLMAYLRHADASWPIMALDVQERLLAWHRSDSAGLGRGISAMPSMHVCVACAFAILGWKISRFWGVAGTVFLLLILIGSVHLGYHYAIDGYVSIVATLLVWWAVGLAVRRYAHAPRLAYA